MDAFSLLKYLRGGAGGGETADGRESSPKPAVLTTAAPLSATDTEDDDNDDEPFFDLDIAVNQTVIDGGDDVSEFAAAAEDDDDEATESDTASSNSGANLALSPSDDLFFKGRLVPIIEPYLAGAGNANSKPQFAVSLKKSATKLRVFMRGLKKSKPGSKIEKSEPGAPPEVERAAAAEVPVKYLLTGEQISDEYKRFALQRYLKKVKPLYVRVSKRYGQDVKASPEDGEASIVASAKLRRPGSFPSALREVSKQLGKTRSAASADVAAAPAGSRRDDSLLEIQDGIQGAILHCKRSFNLKSSAGSEPSTIVRSVSDPLQAKPPRESSEGRQY